jgi:hypothetical protein
MGRKEVFETGIRQKSDEVVFYKLSTNLMEERK